MESKKYKPSKEIVQNAVYKSMSDYDKEYSESISNNDDFWRKKADRIDWFKKWSKISEVDFTIPRIEWFKDAKLNVSYNCIDRHIKNGQGDRITFFWEGNDPSNSKKLTYHELHKKYADFLMC